MKYKYDTTWGGNFGEVELETMDDLKAWMKSFPPEWVRWGKSIVIELHEDTNKLTIEIYNDYRE